MKNEPFSQYHDFQNSRLMENEINLNFNEINSTQFSPVWIQENKEMVRKTNVRSHELLIALKGGKDLQGVTELLSN